MVLSISFDSSRFYFTLVRSTDRFRLCLDCAFELLRKRIVEHVTRLLLYFSSRNATLMALDLRELEEEDGEDDGDSLLTLVNRFALPVNSSFFVGFRFPAFFDMFYGALYSTTRTLVPLIYLRGFITRKEAG